MLVSRTSLHRRACAVVAVAVLGLLGLAAGVPAHGSPARAGARATSPLSADVTGVMPASAANASDPLAGRRWGTYEGLSDPAWAGYLAAPLVDRGLLGPIARAPKAKFFGGWIPDGQIAGKVHEYITNAQAGDPSTLVQMTLFRMEPWEAASMHALPTAAQVASYKTWIRAFVGAVGSTPAAIVVQPDGPDAGRAPHGSTAYSQLIAWTVRQLATLPLTSTYVEMGSADWFTDQPAEAIKLLLADDVEDARGFALDTSHFDATGRNVDFGTKIAAGLAARGVTGKHFVIDTSDNGRPFDGVWFRAHQGQHAVLATAAACRTRAQTHCVTLGIPPTTDVASPRWGLTAAQRAEAARGVDAYLWISRPWLVDQSGAFDLVKALQMVRTTPY